jgi:hypothetical protein
VNIPGNDHWIGRLQYNDLSPGRFLESTIPTVVSVLQAENHLQGDVASRRRFSGCRRQTRIEQFTNRDELWLSFLPNGITDLAVSSVVPVLPSAKTLNRRHARVVPSPPLPWRYSGVRVKTS